MEREGGGRAHQTRGVSSNGGGVGSNPGERDLLLQWGNRKKLRCVKIHQVKKGSSNSTSATVRVGRSDNKDKPDPHRFLRYVYGTTGISRSDNKDKPDPHRFLRNSVSTMKKRSPQRRQQIHMTSSEEKKVAGGTSSGVSEGAVVWPKFVSSLTNREKEEDFMVFKGCNKLPHRPKKRAKCVQRTLNLVCPGSWLCDLTQERYEVQEKKVSKKRPRGLKAMMGNMDNGDSY